VPACVNCGYESERGFQFCPRCGTESGAALPREQRKTVTVLFCDLTGSTALGETLDPERLRAVLARYFDRMKAIVERHGGSVEKFIGDAVMAVFGVPRLHEDDALRAVRAAAEMRDALPELGLEGRIGVMTGEVVTGTEERLATGDAVNVAARLEQAAQPGEVLIGQPTLALVRGAADVEQIEPLELKGKSEPVPAYRLLGVHEMPERGRGERFVGRTRELAMLREAWERVLAEQRCDLITVVGDAGVGKSRLTAEALASTEATVLRGRCPPYGEGITYWPVVGVLKQLHVQPPEGAAAEAVRSLLGETERTTSAEEIAWAFRKTLEHAAAERPLVVVFDDIQWGEEIFLDLIEHVALLSSGASILLFCIARPELTERRPAWPVALRLEPLGDEDVDELIPEGILGELRDSIARASGGNPLFIEEMLAVARETDGHVVVPPTLQALLAARIDQLPMAERSVLERGAIEGEVFHRGAVQALAPEEAQVTSRLAALVRKELITPDAPLFSGEDGFRFRHILIRDAAYDALPKATRAGLHERFASWLEEHGTQLVELDELLGYHLEVACRYRADLGTPDDGALAAEARRRLVAGGHRAVSRQDYGAAVSLLERAATLVPPDEFDLALETQLGEALLWTGRADDALRRADLLAERAAATGDRVGEISGRIMAGVSRLNLHPEGATEELAASIQRALPELEAAGDQLALSIAYSGLAEVAQLRAQMDAALEAFEQAFANARQAGLPSGGIGGLAAYRYFGSTPASDLLEWLDENEPRAGRDQFLRAYRAMTVAMLGHLDEARSILAQARADQSERGGGVLLANLLAFECVDLELWAGDPTAAAEFGAEGFRLHEEMGNRDFLGPAAGNLAQALYALDRLDEADGLAGRSAELGTSDDALKEMVWRQVRAKVLARRGEDAEAERLAREAVAIGEGTDSLIGQGDANADLADVLLFAGRRDEATDALRHALERYERKGPLVLARRTLERLDGLQDASR
jgi:class 3 adenylate cyclase/tetratricopeptide (TPR) repeat protein